MELILEIWREIGRHIDLEDSVGVIAERLGRRIPLDGLLVRRLDLTGPRLETVAAAGAAGPGRVRSDIDHRDLERLVAWIQERAVLSRSPGEPAGPLGLLLPEDPAGGILAGPLTAEDGPLGVLVALAPERCAYTTSDRELFAAVLEPVSAGLLNSLRVHELERLREAFEADRRALLSRLERQEIADSIVGVQTGLRSVMQRVEQVAPTEVPVLILGETGTGKEVVARTIHQRSRRASGPMVRVNCGAIPPELVDSELFGHERGSFTGAVATRRGWFERASGGTLFLDEVGELPPAAQVRLLRILQDGALERVGGQRPLTVDVRVIAATNADLGAMVANGTFRQDLWYRIGVFPLRLPPLRDRAEDIPALAAHFAASAGKRLGFSPLTPSAAELGLLLSYPWPGNVRELAAVIERATILGDGRRLEVAAALGLGSATAVSVRAAEVPAGERLPTLDEAMRTHIERALAATRGRIEGGGGTARLLGINPHTLRARMRKLRIDWSTFRS